MMTTYETPMLRIVGSNSEDIITTSDEYELPIAPGDNDTELPIVPANIF